MPTRTLLSHVWTMALLPIWLVAATPLSAAAQEGRPPERVDGMPPAVMAAHAFLFAAYPDLLDRPLLITTHVSEQGVAVSAADDPGPATSEVPPPPLVTASFVYDADVTLHRFDAFGPVVNEERTLALQDELLAHPRWIDSDADVALTRQGARSTVGTTFEPPHAGAARALEDQLGASRTAAPARFHWYQDGPDGPPIFRSRPAWITEATRSGPDGAPVTYQFEYEPFGGRLIAVVRKGGR